MRVAFAYLVDDRTWLGGKNYLASLFSAVRCAGADDIELVFVTGERTDTSLPVDFPFLEVVRTPMIDRFTPAWWWRQLQRGPSRLRADPALERLLGGLSVDVLSHSGALGSRSAIRTLGWLPDFQFLHLQQYWTPAQLRATTRTYLAATRHCDALVLSSQAALDDLRAFDSRCRAQPHVLRFVAAPYAASTSAKGELLHRFDLPATYFHLPNQFWAHKNHGLVLHALARLRTEGIRPTVVCTGHTQDIRRPDYFPGFVEECRRTGVEGQFRILGVVPYNDMRALMDHSVAVINPSRFEGWSSSVEEAKAMGKRVLLSDIAVHREQAPRDAWYFGTDDPDALADAMRHTLQHPPVPRPAAEIERDHALALKAFGEAYVGILRDLR